MLCVAPCKGVRGVTTESDMKIFISSVQKEFAAERKALAKYIREDAILGKFFEVFIFEEVPAQERSATEVYLSEVDDCDLYLGLHGESYGNVDGKGVSATEREYDRAEKKGKPRICFIKRGISPDERQAAFIAKVNAAVTRRGFSTYDELRTSVYAALAVFLESKKIINTLPFDAAKTAGVQLKHLSAPKIREFVRDAREKRGFKMPLNAKPMDVLTALELVDDKGNIANSAALLFGKRPQHFCISSVVKCAWFLTYRVAKPIADFKVFEGDVFELADQARDFVLSHISRQIGEHEHGAAETTYELPEKAIFEAIVNAICHRDYTSTAGVQVMLFPDRLEVMSPGPLPKGMTVAKLRRRHKSVPVNPLLARAMYMRGYIEHVGSGTGDIIDKCRERGLPPPIWENEDDGMTVTIKRIPSSPASKVSVGTSPETTTKTTMETTMENLGAGTLSVLKAIRTSPEANLVRIAQMVGMTKDGVFYHVKILRAKLGLRHDGSPKKGRWVFDGNLISKDRAGK